ncbi:hypothetical protein FNL55_26570 [Tardiphaga sp. vice352]|uniref:hypothetical protein n=1 Tax=Tardiphaga sp. vice352 TaxID=2592816 RepID=UPI001164DAA2|nr:hypothetical protein [Tardiphaga sp. vice352]QDM34498.1 hypothetical protein FNL55_26570 [Tardiphaga sp. vice352]
MFTRDMTVRPQLKVERIISISGGNPTGLAGIKTLETQRQDFGDFAQVALAVCAIGGHPRSEERSPRDAPAKSPGKRTSA